MMVIPASYAPVIDHDIRPVDWERDAACIIGNWIDTMAARPAGGASRTMIRDYTRRIIERLIREPEVRILVACSRADHDSIYGWICYSAIGASDPETAVASHMGYVKRSYRGMGIMSSLWRAAGFGERFVYTFTPRGIKHVLPHFGRGEHMAIERYLDGE